MNGELAQYFALATHGSAWLHQRDAGAPPELDRISSAFQFVRNVDFAGAPGVGAWLNELSATGVDRIWLAVPGLQTPVADGRLEPHHSAAFAGGLAAGLLTTSATGNQLWRASWGVGDQGAQDRRIWDVSYQPTTVGFGPTQLAITVDHAVAVLDGALEHAARFSRDHDLDPWQAHFAKARNLRSAEDFTTVYHQDLFPDRGYDLPSRRLAATVQAAWVFGGMGSWNDLGFLDAHIQTEYEELTRDLFSAVIQACVAAANTHLISAG
ncbi:hypothetical protein ACIQC7_34985 [Kitasatospora sp. NPDC088556]|uniref:hypothetical protein n=1 Tax=Kitasatospora sp. NPDC088556 TaxID=3364076 RepID=UPI0037F93E5C